MHEDNGRWLTVDEAATRLAVSTRTVWRRIGRGQYETRVGAGGRREVLVTPPATSADVLRDSLAAVREQAEAHLAVAGGAVAVSRELADHLRGEVRGARRSARAAWGLVALLVLGAAAGGTWGMRAFGLAEAQAQVLVGRLADIERDRDLLTGDVAAARTQVQVLVEALAVERSNPTSTSRPASSTSRPRRTEGTSVDWPQPRSR